MRPPRLSAGIQPYRSSPSSVLASNVAWPRVGSIASHLAATYPDTYVSACLGSSCSAGSSGASTADDWPASCCRADWAPAGGAGHGRAEFTRFSTVVTSVSDTSGSAGGSQSRSSAVALRCVGSGSSSSSDAADACGLSWVAAATDGAALSAAAGRGS